MRLNIDTQTIDGYQKFLAVKKLPQYRFCGRTAEFPDEYASRLGLAPEVEISRKFQPSPWAYDYQRDIAKLAVEKRKFSIFADCGLGKTGMFLEYAKHVRGVLPRRKSVLIVSPLMVVPQTLEWASEFYGDSLAIERVDAAHLAGRLESNDGGIVITNYDAMKDDTPQGNVGCLILDESSMLKSHYGKWGQKCLDLGGGLEWKLACTGTPAPNDRIEYANHAVLMDAFPTVNSFLARYFVNRGQTDNRWELKPHALKPFYKSLSHWCIFLSSPATYGWKDNTASIPPIHVHIHDVSLTNEQQGIAFETTGKLFAHEPGGITSRSVLSQVAKGNHRGQRIESNKAAYIRGLVDSWPQESTIIWCIYNEEQKIMEETFPHAASMKGDTPVEERERMIADFKAGRQKVIISKPKIMGFGLNLQIATRQVFSGLQDSYESYYQAVKRSNRIGSTRPLNVHIPITDIERPMIETVLAKAKRVQADTEEQERIFKEATNGF